MQSGATMFVMAAIEENDSVLCRRRNNGNYRRNFLAGGSGTRLYSLTNRYWRRLTTFGQWEGITLSSENKKQFYVLEGFTHGFCVLSETALFVYKCTDKYNPQAVTSIMWDGIQWPISEPILDPLPSQT